MIGPVDPVSARLAAAQAATPSTRPAAYADRVSQRLAAGTLGQHTITPAATTLQSLHEQRTASGLVVPAGHTSGSPLIVPGAQTTQPSALVRTSSVTDRLLRPAPPPPLSASDEQRMQRAAVVLHNTRADRPGTSTHLFETSRGAWVSYMGNFGVANTLITLTGNPFWVIVAGPLSRITEVGTANWRAGAVPNQNPGGGFKQWLTTKFTEELPIQSFMVWYGLQEGFMSVLDRWAESAGADLATRQDLLGQAEHFLQEVLMDPSQHKWAFLLTKLLSGAMAGVTTAVGAQMLRQHMGADMKGVPPEKRGTNFAAAFRKLLDGNPLVNTHLLHAVGRGLSLVPFAFAYNAGMFDFLDAGWERGVGVTAGLLFAAYCFRNDISEGLIKSGAFINNALHGHPRAELPHADPQPETEGAPEPR